MNKNHKWRKKTQRNKNHKWRNKTQMKKNHKWRNILLKKKIEVENIKEVTHENEFMFFFRFSFATVITCGKLICYEKARDLLHQYVYLLFCKLQLLFIKSTCHLQHEYL